jgi:multicomponent K+:H+ antiporter subunit D
VPQLAAENALLAQTAGLLLIVVFCIKAALLPLYFWLPETYGSATAPVAALFAIMTKVGVYCIARTSTLIFGESAGALAGIVQPWLVVLALATLAAAALGMLAADSVRRIAAYAIVASAGFMLTAVGLGESASLSAGLFYLVDSSLTGCALFLVADRIARARPVGGDGFVAAPFGADRGRIAVLFFFFAVAAAGLPPMGAFMGKAMLLRASAGASATTTDAWVWGVVLVTSLLLVIALARAGSAVFWQSGTARTTGAAPAAAHELPLWSAAALLVAVSVFAGDLSRYTRATADQMLERKPYVDAVLGAQPAPPAFDVRREMDERVRQGGAK